MLALRLIPAALACLGFGAPGLAAQAAGYDQDLERATLEGAVLGLDFEDERRIPISAYAPDGSEIAPVVAEDGAHAIEGLRSLRAGGATPYLSIDLSSVREALIDHRIEITLWQRPLGTRLTGDLRWERGDVTLAAISIQPTGRVTTDGWEEWSTGPIDFAFAGYTPDALFLYDEQYLTVFTELDTDVEVALDAVAVIDLGPARVSQASCRLPTESIDCGPDGACALGRCGDAAAILGAPLYDRGLRADLLARHAIEVELFEGSRRARALAATFAATLSRLAEPTTVTDYWTSIRRAYQSLGDGHLTPPRAGAELDFTGGACAYDADADLLPGRPQAPMVFEADPRHPLGALLQVGDVIGKIDGLEPFEWAMRAERLLAYGGDPAGRRAQIAPKLLQAAVLSGSVIELWRCALTRPCATSEVEVLEIDLRALIAPILASEQLDELRRTKLCDFRFRRPVSSDPVSRRTDYAGSRSDGTILSIQINGVPYDRDWVDGIERAFSQPADRILLDQRLGNGGSSEAMSLLVSRLIGTADLHRAELWMPVGVSETPALREQLAPCAPQGCAGLLGFDFFATSSRRGAFARSKLAVLDGRDIAGNDFTAYALGLRREGQTRIFGPAPTYGAFGPKAGLPRLPGEVSGASIQTHDTVFLAPGDDHFDFASGRGVAPDEVVLQRQSDAARGIDTVLEAARAWLVTP